MTKAVELAQVASNGVSEAFKNRIINGAMVISQRGTSFTSINTDPVYTLDRWCYAMNGGGAMSSTQSSVAPSGFINSILSTVTTADGTVSSSSYYQLRQAIEGFNVADLNWGTANAKTVTLSFWVNCSVTGTYSVSLRSNLGNNSYVTTYSIPSANTWTYITVTVPGPTSGTWLSNNGVGIFATWDFGTGSTSVTSSTNTWLSGNFTGATGATKLINTNGATFYITGVQLEVGSTATSFDYRPYGTELQLCQRYLPVFNSSSTFDLIGFGYTTGTTNAQMSFEYFVPPRVPPTGVTNTAASSFFFYYGPASYGVSAISFVAGSSRMATINCTISAPSGGLSGVLFTNSATAQLLFTGCEL